VSLSGNGSILCVGNDQSIILRGVTLRGHESNNASLVTVSGNGTFTMNSGEISGNTANPASDIRTGGGVVGMGGATLRIVTGTIYGSHEMERYRSAFSLKW
jgi:hypothetical protein